MIAVSSGFTEIVELLLQKGANVNAQNENGQTCMHYVASRNRQRVRSIFLRISYLLCTVLIPLLDWIGWNFSCVIP